MKAKDKVCNGIVAIMMCILANVFFASCSEDSPYKHNQKELVGTWQLVNYDQRNMDYFLQYLYLNDNGYACYSQSYQGLTNAAQKQWFLTDGGNSLLIFSESGGSTYSFDKLEFLNDKTWKAINSDGVVFIYRRL